MLGWAVWRCLGHPWFCFLFLFCLHQRAPRWLVEKHTIMQSRSLALCVETQSEKQSCPFTPMILNIFGSVHAFWWAVEFNGPKAFASLSNRTQVCFLGMRASTKCCQCVLCLPATLPPPGFARVLWAHQTSLSAHREHINYVLHFHWLFRRI